MKTSLLKYSYLFMVLVVMAACHKDPVIVDDVKSTKLLVAPFGFEFDMTRNLTIEVILPKTVNYLSNNRIIELWSVSEDGKPATIIRTGTADSTGLLAVTIDVPGCSGEILTHCFAGWRSVRIQGSGMKGTNELFTVDYNAGYGKTPPKVRQGQEPSNPDAIRSIRFNRKSGTENMIKNGDFSSATLDKMDTWSSPMSLTGNWNATNEATQYGSIISEGGNTFARINSSPFTSGGFAQLVPAKPGQVVTFSGDTRGFDSQQNVYLYLIPRNESGDYIDVLSYNISNPGIMWINGTIAGSMPEGTVACQVMFYKESTGIVDFDNAVVHINDLNSDRDGDKVLDWEDNYPDDPELAFDDFYPALDKPGTFAFEDLWPSQGDYDFNDLVVDYEINRISNAKNRIVEIDIHTWVRAIGGSLRNGFGIQLDLSPDDILGIKNSYEFQNENIRLDENGTESGQQKATFIMFENAYNILKHAGDGSPGVNTSLGYKYVFPSEKILKILLKRPLNSKELSIEKFNPFIFRTTDRSMEIHLSGFAPTDLADTKLFATGTDVSDPSNGIYYQTKNGLPWAINIPVKFSYTLEKSDIVGGYPSFAKWVSSGGLEYQDWYLDIQGYRNWENIYRW